VNQVKEERIVMIDNESVYERWDAVLGIEVHVELNTRTKMFCSCRNQFGAVPNTNTCPVCLGFPGSLPVINKKAVECAVRLGLALNAKIEQHSFMARKNYFYPDLAKNYQISQSDKPIVFDGHLDVPVDDFVYRVNIERAHMEEDAAKNTHVGGADGRIEGADFVLVDYNRGGVPLIEIVTRPMTGLGAKAGKIGRNYIKALRDLVIALGISDAKMEEGSLRADVNVSLRPKVQADGTLHPRAAQGADSLTRQTVSAQPAEFSKLQLSELTGAALEAELARRQNLVPLGTRTETKNINSFKSIEHAIQYEVARQAELLESGGKVVQETRHFVNGATTSGRLKSDSDDYRYFPDPDLVTISPSTEFIESLKNTIPESPALKHKRLQLEWDFTDLEMRDIIKAEVVELIEKTVEKQVSPAVAKKWIMGEILKIANAKELELAEVPVRIDDIVEIDTLTKAGKINDKIAKDVIAAVIESGKTPVQIVNEQNLEIISDTSALEEIVVQVLEKNQDIKQRLAGGDFKPMGVIIGQVMRETKGKADAKTVTALIRKNL
jgi:aspartyl-tRNA(Asn)/glutamyl-tRNA(Gln) amidotransferase subunit B